MLRTPTPSHPPVQALPPFMSAGPESAPTRRAKKGSKKGRAGCQKKKRASKKPARKIEYILLPKHWFSEPMVHAMKTAVRPPTRLTRRKQQKLEMRVPQFVFIDLVKLLESGCVAGFEWTDETKTALKPTKEKKTFHEFSYTINKPELNDRLWQLESHEKAPARATDKAGKIKAFRRGQGCARLHLSKAAQERGEKSMVLSQITGSVVLKLKVPLQERAMPTMTVMLAVSTMDAAGHVVWANEYAPRTAAALRKQMRHHLQSMIENAEYPTLSEMSPALNVASDSLLTLPAPRGTSAAE